MSSVANQLEQMMKITINNNNQPSTQAHGTSAMSSHRSVEVSASQSSQQVGSYHQDKNKKPHQHQQQRNQNQNQNQQQSARPTSGQSESSEPQQKRHRPQQQHQQQQSNNNQARGQNNQPKQQQQRQQVDQKAEAASNQRQHLQGQSKGQHQQHASASSSASAAASSSSLSSSSAIASDQTFASLKLNALTQRAMDEQFGYVNMTQVQAQSIPVSLSGVDVLAKAKTGSGKTLAFLVPAVHTILSKPQQQQPRGADRGIQLLVISPTRELAAQIGVEATKLCAFNGLSVEVVFGGTNISGEVKRIKAGVDILIGTPGRMIDHLESDKHAQLDHRLQSLRVLVLDEADRLLDMGFRPSLETIFKYLPAAGRKQTLLFSATLPDGVMDIVKKTLRPGYQFVNTVAEDDEQTVHQVEQHACLTPLENQLEVCLDIIYSHIQQQSQKGENYKIMMFFTTARMTQFVAALFQQPQVRASLSVSSANKKTVLPIWEIHSRKSQSFRTRASDEFRAAAIGLLMSSDVSARGVDYPGVTLVVQVGLTDRESYIHRLGRTARAGTKGQGVLLLAEFEQPMLKSIADLPVEPMVAPAFKLEPSPMVQVLDSLSSNADLKSDAELAWISWLGFYNSHLRLLRWDKQGLVARANEYSPMLGLSQPPALLKKTIGMMGLKGVPGLRIDNEPIRQNKK